MPLAIRWPGDVAGPGGRRFRQPHRSGADDPRSGEVSRPPASIVGRSLVPLIRSDGTGQSMPPETGFSPPASDIHRPGWITSGTPAGPFATPISSTSATSLPIAGLPAIPGESAATRPATTISMLSLEVALHHSTTRQPDLARYFRLAVEKRPAEELFDLKTDPGSVENVAGRPQYTAALQRLRGELEQHLTATGDPRVLGRGALQGLGQRAASGVPRRPSHQIPASLDAGLREFVMVAVGRRQARRAGFAAAAGFVRGGRIPWPSDRGVPVPLKRGIAMPLRGGVRLRVIGDRTEHPLCHRPPGD